MSTFGERLKTARISKGLTQTELAELLDLQSSSGVRSWEKNIGKPNCDQISGICSALDISPNDLFEFKTSSQFTTDEVHLIEKYRLLDDFDQEFIQNAVVHFLNRSASGNPGHDTSTSVISISKSVFLNDSDPNYAKFKSKAREFKRMRNKRYRPIEAVTYYLWDIGYGSEICLATVKMVFMGILVPSPELYNDIHQYLTKEYLTTAHANISIIDDE